MSSFKDYALDSEKTNKGVKLPLIGPDGKLSDDYLMIRWVYDDKVRAALSDLERKAVKLIVPVTSEMTKKEREQAELDNEKVKNELIASGMVSQVASWSFEEKSSPENIKEFLSTRPDVSKRIDNVASSTNLFFGNSEKSS
jgi:hypothetical protein